MVIRASRWIGIAMMCLLLGTVSAQERPLYALPDANTRTVHSASIALTSTGRFIAVANFLNDTVSLFDLQVRASVAEIPVGDDPRSVAFSPNNQLLLVVNRGSGTLSIVDVPTRTVTNTYTVGILPYGVIAANDQFAYVTLQGTHEVIQIDFTTGRIVERITTPPDPTGLAIWGNLLYITHLWSGDFSLIYTPQGQVVRVISTGDDVSLAQSVMIDPTSARAYLPQSRSNADATAITYDTTIFPVVNVVDLRNMSVIRNARIALDVADRPVNMPFSLDLDTTRGLLYVANAGTNDISVINLATGLAQAHVVVGGNPRGVILNLDNSIVVAHNAIDGSLSLIDTRDFSISTTVPVSDLNIPIDEAIGAELFHSANDPRMSSNWVSCANCHFDGQSDGRAWQDMNGVVQNTPVLYGLLDSAPYTSTGAWDELADIELKIRSLQAGYGLIETGINPPLGATHSGLSIDLDALVFYITTFKAPPTSTTHAPELIESGEAIFTELECATCHIGTLGLDGMSHDVGTGGDFDTPTLNWLWMSAPYFHDGRAQTLQEVFLLDGVHQIIGEKSLADIDALVAYLQSLPR
ncbi:MAG: beta-propeller fold lactonase family protein [Phototrophicales bacterium]|nr:beta-propeller fold lactonase family protein [Phototrophicales bacterium]